MKELKLEHIAKRLPFGLKYVTREGENDILADIYADGSNSIMSYYDALECNDQEAVALSNDVISINETTLINDEDGIYLGCGTLENHGYDVDDIYLSEVLPILRPLSDINKLAHFDLSHMNEGLIFEDYFIKGSGVELSYFTKVYNWLLEHHFDVDNLISQGLAIDVNTLSVNPYK